METLQLRQEGKEQPKTGVFWLLALALLALAAAVYLVLPHFDAYHSQFKYVETVFDQDRVTDVRIIMDEADLADLLANPLEEKMYSATVVINGRKMEHVGVRTKGNSSLRSIANSDSNRYSLKIDFDYYISDQHLDGLRKLNLNNNFSDSTQMREYVSYKLMEYMGVPTPAFSYMYVTVNGQEWGLYLGVESIEEPFLERTFADATGDLYKPEGIGSDLKWISDKIEDYTGLNLKTNVGSTDQSAMMAFLDAINHGGDLEQVMDVDEMLRYFAANTALVNLDSYQGQMKHNYYLYEKDGIFSILPWDYNMSFGGFGAGGMGRFGGMGGFGGFGGGVDGEAEEGAPRLGGEASNESGDVLGDAAQGGFPPGNMPGGRFPAQGGADLGAAPQMNMPGAGFPAQGGADQGAAPQMNIPGGRFPAQGGADQGTVPQGDMPQGGFPQGGWFGRGNMPDMSANWFSDSNINFSITTPVSGTTLEDRPLLNALLSVDEYRAKYEQYLEDIAVNFLTEEHIRSMMEQVSELILPYVERDPTKFYSTEAFLEGINGEQSLPAFAKRRAESILAQLSGELAVEAETGGIPGNLPGGFGGFPAWNENGGWGDFGQVSGQRFPNRGGLEGQQPSDFGNVQGRQPNGNVQPIPDQGGQPGRRNPVQTRPDGMQSPDMPGNMPGESREGLTTGSFNQGWLALGLAVLLSAAIVFVALFQRRRVPRRQPG